MEASDSAVPRCAHDAHRLSRLLQESLTFACRTVRCADRHSAIWAVDLGQVSGYEKMILEASLFAMITSRRSISSANTRDLAVCIREQYDSADALGLMMRRPETATTLGTTILALDSLGLATDLERRVLDRALSSPFADGSERVPFRLLDREWVKHLAGRSTLSDVDQLVSLSAACRANHPIHMSREDAYAITHTIMYATDFGRLGAPASLSDPRLHGTIDASLAWCLAAGDFDLVAELLMSQLMLTGGFTPYGRLAWAVTARTWDDLGFLPSPSLSVETLQQHADEAERQQYAFQQMYHTMFVGGLLVDAMMHDGVGQVDMPASERWLGELHERLVAQRALLGNRRCEPGSPAWWPTDGRVDELIDKWAPIVDPQGELAMIDRATIERMAVDAACIEAARNDDVAGVVAAVVRATSLSIATPTDAIALLALAGQALPSGAIGTAFIGDEIGGWPDAARGAIATCVAATVAAVFDTMIDRLHPARYGKHVAVAGAR